MRDQIYIAPDPLPHFLPTKYFDQKKVFQRLGLLQKLCLYELYQWSIVFSVETRAKNCIFRRNLT